MSTIITRNSATSGSTPSSLVQGELAINVTDGRLFYGSGSGNVVKEFTGSASGGGATNTGSLLVTASFSNPNLTFTKGNGSTFNVNLVSLVPTSASFASTASFAPNYVLNSATSSFVTNAQTSSFVLNSQTSSMSVASASFASTASFAPNYVLNSATSSFVTNAQTSSFVQNSQTSSMTVLSASFASTASFAPNYVLNSATSSFVTNAQTSSMSVASASFALTASYYNETDPVFVAKSASLATTGSNTFNGSQTINGDLIVNGTASITFLNVTYESASVIYSSGSNQFGDASNDTQTLWGTVDIKSGPVLVTGSLNVSGGITGSLLGTASYALNALSASYALTASYVQNAQTASFITASGVYGPYGSNSVISASHAVNGGVTQLLAGSNITLSPTTGKGQVTISSTGGGGPFFNTATGSYGSFYDTTTQTNPVGNIARSMSLDTTDITNGVSVSGSTNPFNTYIKTENAGVYNIQFSAQVEKTDSATDVIVIWLRKNGIDLTDTATKMTLTGNGTKVVAAWNWFVTSAANDYYQIIWISADTGMRLYAEPQDGTPGIPSVIVTVNRVDQFLSNTGSFSGSFTGNLIGTSSFATTASYVQTAQTASYVLNAVSSSFASTASFVTASNVYGPFGSNSVISSSYALTASYALTSAGGGSGAGFPFTGSAVITGSLIVTGSATFTDSILIDSTLVTSSIVTTTGAATTTISTQATGSYRSMFAKYTVSNSTNARAGEFMAVWNAGNIQFTDTSTTDIGDTSALTLIATLTATNVELSTDVGSGWTVKTQTTYV